MSDLVKNLSLFQIESELAELMETREEMKAAGEDTAAIDAQVKAYAAKELVKVDGLRNYMRMCENQIAAAAEEEARVSAFRRSWQSRYDYLKGYVKDAMGVLGKKTLPGLHGSISLQNNGGYQALEIYSAALIPEEMVLYRGWMSSAAMKKIPVEISAREDFQFEREPRQGVIRCELAKPCSVCAGAGEVMEVGGISEKKIVCPECKGTKAAIVPGARLEPRGTHLRLK